MLILNAVSLHAKFTSLSKLPPPSAMILLSRIGWPLTWICTQQIPKKKKNKKRGITVIPLQGRFQCTNSTALTSSASDPADPSITRLGRYCQWRVWIFFFFFVVTEYGPRKSVDNNALVRSQASAKICHFEMWPFTAQNQIRAGECFFIIICSLLSAYRLPEMCVR